MTQNDDDLRVLRELTEEIESPAFDDMLEKLEAKLGSVLSPKQRRWVNQVAVQNRIEPSPGPEDDSAPEPVRLTAGEIPRGKEVALLVKDKPLKPPTRKT